MCKDRLGIEGGVFVWFILLIVRLGTTFGLTSIFSASANISLKFIGFSFSGLIFVWSFILLFLSPIVIFVEDFLLVF